MDTVKIIQCNLRCNEYIRADFSFNDWSRLPPVSASDKQHTRETLWDAFVTSQLRRFGS